MKIKLKMRYLSGKVINIEIPTHDFKSLYEFRVELENDAMKLENAGCNFE